MSTTRDQKSCLSSQIERPAVNDSPADVAEDDAAEERARDHRRMVRRVMRSERRIRSDLPAPGPKPISKPKCAEAVLAALAAVYKPGSRVRLSDIAAAGCPRYIGGQVRRWARSVDRWPYRDGGSGASRAGGGS